MHQLMPKSQFHPIQMLFPFHQGINHLQLLEANVLFIEGEMHAGSCLTIKGNSSSLRLILIIGMFLRAVFYPNAVCGFHSSLAIKANERSLSPLFPPPSVAGFGRTIQRDTSDAGI